MGASESGGVISREEVEVLVQARQELTPEHEAELIEGFLERVDDAIDARVDERMAELGKHHRHRSGDFEVTLGSIALGIPITAIAGSNAGLGGVIAAWTGIVVVNVLYLVRSR